MFLPSGSARDASSNLPFLPGKTASEIFITGDFPYEK
jgi:hypothetical protein